MDAGLAPDGAVLDPWQPAAAAPPVLTPCPTGWSEAQIDGVAACEPHPSGALECPPGEAHFPGEAGCVRVGRACPTGDFPDDAPPGAVFVRPGSAGGVGTRESPVATIADALRISPTGTTIVLAKGRHEGPVTLRTGVTLQGACAASTLLSAPMGVVSTTERIVTVQAGGVALRDMTIGRAPRPGVLVSGDGFDLSIEGVAIEETRGTAVTVALGATVSARDVSVRDIDIAEGTTARGYGLGFEQARPSTIERVSIVRATGGGILAGNSSSVSLRDAIIRDTRGSPVNLRHGNGLTVLSGSTIDGARVVLSGNRDIAVLIDAATLRLEDAIVRGTVPAEADREFGRGFGVQLGSSAELRRVRVEGNRDVGIQVTSAQAVLEDVVVRDTASNEASGQAGRGLNVSMSSTVRATRVLLARNREVGAMVDHDGSLLVLEDVTSIDSLPIDGPEYAGQLGVGVLAARGGRTEMRRVEIARARTVGVFASGAGSSALLEEVWVHDTLPQESNGALGRAISIESGAHADALRCSFSASHEAAVVVNEASAAFEHVAVREVQPRRCASEGLCPDALGMGVSVINASAVTLADFVIDGASLCGVQIATASDLTLRDGVVEHNEIGACVQIDGYDLTKLMQNVAYRENTTTIDATSLPVPEPLQPGGP